MLTIRPFDLFSPEASARDAAAFKVLNQTWIEHYFTMEAEDHQTLNNPIAEIIELGGYIALAEDEGRIIACGALYPAEHGSVELFKMAVEDGHQGKGVGKKLGLHLIQQAEKMGKNAIHIISNDRLEAAMKLYRQLGFSSDCPPRHQRYERGNISFYLPLPYLMKEQAA